MLRKRTRKYGRATQLSEERLSELELARRWLERAQARFNGATDDSFDFANSELTAALKHLEYVASSDRRTAEDRQGRYGEWESA